MNSILRMAFWGGTSGLEEAGGEIEKYRACVLFGMAAFFSSVIRLPLCGTLISVEMVAFASLGDRETALCFPILLCAMVSYVTSVYFNPETLFEQMLEQDREWRH